MHIQPRTHATLITGFLGAGKTTFINTLLSHKAQGKWAILVNEFGKIGIDGKLFIGDDIATKEINGGCICCTSQLSLQIAIAQLMQSHEPQRLLIEPTGLAHPDELSEQLSLAHWQNSLQLNAIIAIVNASQWLVPNYRTHDGYIAHVKCADVVVINCTHLLNDDARQALFDWVSAINPTAKIIDMDKADGNELISLLDIPKTPKPTPAKISLFAQPRLGVPSDDTAPPYRYHDNLAEFCVAGWRLPKTWVFDGHELQKWLLNLPHYVRIKGVICTTDGWISLNITPQSISIQDTDPKDDSRLELILTQDANWDMLDNELMEFLVAK